MSIDKKEMKKMVHAAVGVYFNSPAKLHHKIEQLRAENEKLREALKPFADAVLKDEYSWKYDINSDDFRAAAAAIRESGDE